MIKIINMRSGKKLKLGVPVIPVDRTTRLGNPFHMKNETERDKVCEEYEAYFNKKVAEKTDEKFMNDLRAIYKLAKNGDVYLACWCYPKRCHAETIKKFIESYL